MQALCTLLTAASLLFHAAFGGGFCLHGRECHAGSTAQSLPCDFCCTHDHGSEPQPRELPSPCKCCLRGVTAGTYLPAQKTTVDVQAGWVAYHPVTAFSTETVLESVVGKGAPQDEISQSRPPLYLVYQVFLI